MPTHSRCGKINPYGSIADPTNPKMTYALAHSARCKLNMSAKDPDRNLRMVLGHAFALDNMLVRIVEIEHETAANEAKAANNTTPTVDSEIAQQDAKTAGVGGGTGVRVGETGSLARPQSSTTQPQRRVSFGNSADFRPSDLTGGSSNTSNNNGSSSPRNRSPPPATNRIPKGYSDEESTSSDDYDDDLDAANAFTAPPPSSLHQNVLLNDAPPQDPYEEPEPEPALGLTRFQSATATRPRSPPKEQQLQPPPEDEPPALEEDISDEDLVEDRPEPPSPPAFGEDVVRDAMLNGEKDEELGELYESLRGCPCCKQHGSAPKKQGLWRVKSRVDGGKEYAILAEEAGTEIAVPA